MRATLAAAALLTITPTLSAEVPLVWEEVRAAYLALVESGQPGPDEAENGWPVLVELGEAALEHIQCARETLGLIVDGVDGLTDDEKLNLAWWPESLRAGDAPAAVTVEARTQLQSLSDSGYFARLDSALAADRFVHDPDKFFSVPIEQACSPADSGYAPLRAIQRIELAHLRTAIDRREAATAGASLGRLLKFNRAMQLQRMPLLALIGDSGANSAQQFALKALLSSPPDLETAHSLLEALNKQQQRLPIAEILRGNPYCDRLANLSTQAERNAKEPSVAMRLVETGIAVTLIAQRDAATGRAIAASRLPRPERAARGLDDESLNSHADSIATSLLVFESHATEQSAAHLLLAIELHRLERGGLPESLDDLVPGYLAALPTDIFAADGRFRYRVTEPDESGTGRGYLLYSVAYDGVDNDGAAAPTTWDALMGRAPGMDAVFNTWLDR